MTRRAILLCYAQLDIIVLKEHRFRSLAQQDRTNPGLVKMNAWDAPQDTIVWLKIPALFRAPKDITVCKIRPFRTNTLVPPDIMLTLLDLNLSMIANFVGLGSTAVYLGWHFRKARVRLVISVALVLHFHPPLSQGYMNLGILEKHASI